MEKYTMWYRRESTSRFTASGKSADVNVYTATLEAPNAATAEKQLINREAKAGLGRKIRIIRTITEK